MAWRAQTSGSEIAGTNISITVPTVAQDDIVLVCVSQDVGGALTITPSSGFTQLDTFTFAAATPDGHNMRLYWKRATASEGSSYAFTSSASGGTNGIGWTCTTHSGRHLTTAPTNSQASSTANNVDGTAITAASITAGLGDDAVWIACMDVTNVNGGNGITPNASYTERVDLIDGGGGWVNIEVATSDALAAGSTGTVAGSGAVSVTGFGWVVFHVLLPVAGGGIGAQRQLHRPFGARPGGSRMRGR